MKRVQLAPLAALLVALFFACGACGGARDVPDRQLEALRAEIVKLRNETAMLADRVGALERPAASSRGAAPKDAPETRDESSDRPPLEVVRLEPGAQASPEAAAKQAQGERALLGDAAFYDEQEGDDDDAEPRLVLRSVAGGGVVEEKAKKAAAPVKGKPALGVQRAAKAEVPR